MEAPGMVAMKPISLRKSIVMDQPLEELQLWWWSIAQITKEESPLLYEMSAFDREWAKNNGHPHAP